MNMLLIRRVWKGFYLKTPPLTRPLPSAFELWDWDCFTFFFFLLVVPTVRGFCGFYHIVLWLNWLRSNVVRRVNLIYKLKGFSGTPRRQLNTARPFEKLADCIGKDSLVFNWRVLLYHTYNKSSFLANINITAYKIYITKYINYK